MPKVQREIAAGSLAASFTATLFSPLECVKTRLQVQDLPGWPRIYESGGLLSTLRRIASEDGVLMLWSHGFVGFVARDFLYSGLRIGLYPTFRSALAADGNDAPLSAKIAAGAGTGAFGASIANPLDVVRVRMSCEYGVIDAASGTLTTGMRVGEKPRWRNSFHCLVACYESEGLVGGLWRGVSATVARAALLSAGQLASYDHSKQCLLRQGYPDGSQVHSLSAIISGLVATTVCNPADVMKSALMSAARDASAGAKLSPLAIASTIVRTQGVLGFWRGWTAACAHRLTHPKSPRRVLDCYWIAI
jgi:hypothetical protein